MIGLRLLAASFLLLATAAGAGEGFARQLPDFRLRDPAGRLHTKDDLVARGVVFVVTAPTFASEDDQRGWDEALRATRPERSQGRLVFIEDLASSWVPGLALSSMKKEFKPGQEPLVLVDQTGSVRSALGVEADTTVVLVYDQAGRLVHDDAGQPGADAATRAWAALPPPPPAPPTPPTR